MLTSSKNYDDDSQMEPANGWSHSRFKNRSFQQFACLLFVDPSDLGTQFLSHSDSLSGNMFRFALGKDQAVERQLWISLCLHATSVWNVHTHLEVVVAVSVQTWTLLV